MIGVALVSSSVTGFSTEASAAPARLLLATTTSVNDSGLLGVLLPAFGRIRTVPVEVVAVGTGQAFALARRGDADVLIVHEPIQELEFVRQGLGITRNCIAYNTFVIIGPSGDPAQVRSAPSAVEAFSRVARSRALFISRGDASGTEAKEQEIWRQTGISPRGEPWYLSSGAGMGMTLTMAHEKRAYTPTDIATYLTMRARLQLPLLFEGDPILRNQYGAIAVNPTRFPTVNHADASALISYLVSYEAQQAIAAFGRERFGRPLFVPLGGRCSP
jgi:tungstate transport system substrate-binding protein